MKIALGLLSVLAVLLQGPDRPIAPEIGEALQLRARLGVEDQWSDYAIFVRSIAAHHIVEEYTRVATRDGNGVWTVASIGESRPGLVATQTSVIPLERKTLSREEGERLDRFLTRPDLFTQPSPRDRDPVIGAPVHTMEIVTPHRRTTFRWTGHLRGSGGQVADLIIGGRASD